MQIIIYNNNIMGCCKSTDKTLHEMIQNQFLIIEKLTKYNKILLDEISDLKEQKEEQKVKIEYQQNILSEYYKKKGAI